MSPKTRLFQIASKIVLSILQTVDLLTGSNSGRDPLDVRRDPYTGFRMMRERGPIIRTYATRGWFVVGFEAVQAVFKDPRFGADMRKNKFLVRVLRAGADGKRVPTLDDPSLLTLDAPDHTRLRKLVSRGFLNKYMQSLEPHVEMIGNLP
jgi:cytochrome P450